MEGGYEEGVLTVSLLKANTRSMISKGSRPIKDACISARSDCGASGDSHTLSASNLLNVFRQPGQIFV